VALGLGRPGIDGQPRLCPVNRRQVLQAMAAACLLILAAFVGSVLHTGAVTPDPLPSPAASTGTLVVIGTGGIRPGDLDRSRTPALWGLLRDGSSAALNITSVHATTCPVDGWLTLSAGDRAGQPDDGTPSPRCGPLPDVVGGRVSGWEVLAKAAADRPFGARLGTLGAALAGQGQCISAIGLGAAVGAALPPDGAVPRYQGFGAETLMAGLGACRTSFVDVGSVQESSGVQNTSGANHAPQTAAHQEEVAAADGRIAQVIKAAPAGADVLVLSLADAGDQPGLGLALAAGPRFGPGTLYSTTTRQGGLVQLQDVTATILSLGGAPVPDRVTGSALRRSPAAGNSEALAERRHGGLVDYDLSSRSVRPVVYPFFVGWGLLMLSALAGLTVLWWRRLGSAALRDSVRSAVRQGFVVSAAVPVSSFLANIVPWWRFRWPALALVLAVTVWASVIGAVALRGGWRRSPMGPVAAVAAMTFVVLAADVMNGSRLQLSSLLGLNPIVGGRFYGMGNVTFALFMAATFLVAIAVSSRLVSTGHRRVAALAVGLVGFVAVVVDAVPIWGSDIGGPPALVPGLAVLILSILEVRVTWRRALLVIGATAGLVALLAVADWLRPPASRSHLGRFVQSLLDGDAGAVVTRKLAQNLETLVATTIFAYLVPVALVLIGYVLAHPRSVLATPLRPLLDTVATMRTGLVGLTVSLAIGLLVNDTGVAIPPIAFSLVVPLLISAGIRLWELRSRQGLALTRVERWHS
jgi:hypothetical protein